MINLFALIIIFIGLKYICNNKICNNYVLLLTLLCYLLYHFFTYSNIENFEAIFNKNTNDTRKPLTQPNRPARDVVDIQSNKNTNDTSKPLTQPNRPARDVVDIQSNKNTNDTSNPLTQPNRPARDVVDIQSNILPSKYDWDKDFQSIDLTDEKNKNSNNVELITKIEDQINKLQKTYQDALNKQITYQRKNQKQYDSKYDELSQLLQSKINTQLTNLETLKTQIKLERNEYGNALREVNNSINNQLQKLREDLLSNNKYMSFDNNSVWIK